MAASGYVAADEGEALWHFGGLAVIKLDGEATDGEYALLDELMPKGSEAYLHVHSREDETFVVVDGEVTFTIGEQTVVATSGAVVSARRGVPHAFRVESETARFLSFIRPAGLENAIRELSPPATTRTLPPTPIERPSIERMRKLGADYGIDFLE
jgi:mannose-6-phosphate isomerase-like protein (cupin superfamily)